MSEKNDSSELLLSAISGNDKQAFDTFFVRYYARLKYFVMGICGDEDLAENTVQDIFMNIWIRRHDLQSIRSIESYLFTCAHHSAISLLQKMEREQHLARLPEEEDNSTEDDIYYHELEALINERVAAMPEQRRKVFRMSRMEGMKNQEIAKELGISVRTVEKHISSALTDLRTIEYILLLMFIHTTGL